MTDFVIEKLKGETKQPEYRWTAMLGGGATTKSEKKPATKSAVKKPKDAAEKKTARVKKAKSAQ